jgi:hypothetical protein
LHNIGLCHSALSYWLSLFYLFQWTYNEFLISFQQVVVLLTAGRTSPDSDARALGAAAKPLRDLGAKTYVIAIGKEPNTNELLPTVQYPRDIFRIQSYDLLPVELPSTARQIGDRTG